MAPNQCNCPENFFGPQCQFENKPCLNYPPLPQNSRRTCNSKQVDVLFSQYGSIYHNNFRQCTITCMEDHEFPDGSQIANLICKDGQWVPSKTKWSSVPDCAGTSFIVFYYCVFTHFFFLSNLYTTMPERRKLSVIQCLSMSTRIQRSSVPIQ